MQRAITNTGAKQCSGACLESGPESLCSTALSQLLSTCSFVFAWSHVRLVLLINTLCLPRCRLPPAAYENPKSQQSESSRLTFRDDVALLTDTDTTVSSRLQVVDFISDCCRPGGTHLRPPRHDGIYTAHPDIYRQATVSVVRIRTSHA